MDFDWRDALMKLPRDALMSTLKTVFSKANKMRLCTKL
jgi:hypothetical protein